jgi:hypothetical protein
METSSIPAVTPITKNKRTRPISPGIQVISGKKRQYVKTDTIPIRLLPFRIMSHPVNGIAKRAPTEVDKSTKLQVPLSNENISCIRGNRAARLACINPLIKKIKLTATRGWLLEGIPVKELVEILWVKEKELL